MVRISNIPVKDLLSLLNEIAKDYDLVDLIVDPDNRKVTLQAVDGSEEEDIDDLPEEDQELTEDNMYDII